jgi:hypothetical protein
MSIFTFWRRCDVAAPISLPDDWAPAYGEWVSGTFCHCGRGWTGDAPKVCPTCGHTDQFKTGVGRGEWMESPARKRAWDARRHPIFGVWIPAESERFTKDAHVVMWTEKNCTKPKWEDM